MAASKKSMWFFFQKRSVRITLALCLIVACLGGCALLFWFSARGMFYANPRFVIRQLRIHSSGWWHGREKELANSLHIVPGVTNLFALDLPQLRKDLVRNESGVEQVTIRRELPDILHFEIDERIPRAFISSPKSALLLDSAGFVVRQDRCINLNLNLPVVLGLHNDSDFVPGQRIPQAGPALELIMLTVTECPDVRIATVSLHDKRFMVCALYYRNRLTPDDVFRVYLPYDGDRKDLLRKLITALERVRTTNNPKRTIKLLYRDRAVLE